MTKRKKQTFLLIVVYFSFFALGIPDGAFGVAWPGIRAEMNLPLEWAQAIFMTQALVYALLGFLSGRIAQLLRQEYVSLLGLLLMGTALFGFSLSPNFITLVAMAACLGTGMGLIDSSLNAYMAKHFSSRHMNWLHCFWGLGASFSPIVMTQAVLLFSWRTGYVSLATIHGIAAGLILISLFRRVWPVEEREALPDERPNVKNIEARPFLTKKRFQYMQMTVFFLYTGLEYSAAFWTVSVLIESRGVEIGFAGLYPAVFLGFMTGGRILFGYLAKYLSNISMIRCGFFIAFAGLAILIASAHITGMALMGLGFAPIFPSLMHETSKRFHPSILTKLVGYQIAAVGAGVALVSAFVGQILSRVSLEALFPLVAVFALIAFLLNEWIERAAAS